jgi:hypothetical protein
MSILNITPIDFEDGPYCIATNKHTTSQLQSYIDEWEVKYLEDMLGCALYTLFAADLNSGVPQSQRFIDIFNPFCIDDDCGQRRSEGIKTMIEKFVFWKYVRDQKVSNTNTGNIVNSNEVSRETSFSESKLYQIYNEAIKTYCNIQWYICDNSNLYPEFEGIVKRKTSWL